MWAIPMFCSPKGYAPSSFYSIAIASTDDSIQLARAAVEAEHGMELRDWSAP